MVRQGGGMKDKAAGAAEVGWQLHEGAEPGVAGDTTDRLLPKKGMIFPQLCPRTLYISLYISISSLLWRLFICHIYIYIYIISVWTLDDEIAKKGVAKKKEKEKGGSAWRKVSAASKRPFCDGNRRQRCEAEWHSALVRPPPTWGGKVLPKQNGLSSFPWHAQQQQSHAATSRQ